MARWTFVVFVVLLSAWAYCASGLQDSEIPANQSLSPQVVVSSSEILAQIGSGHPITYNDVAISGNLDLSDLERRIKQPLKITNSTFTGAVNFDHVAFEAPLDFRGTTFQDYASFNKTLYLEDALFSAAGFLGKTYFRFAEFDKPVSFSRARFENQASFANAQFGANTNFERVEFLADADFELAQFYRPVNFMAATFLGECIFSNSHFESAAIFMSCRYNGNASFAGARFLSDVIFRSSRFQRSAIFGLASFGGFTDFANVDFRDVAYFAVTKFDDNGHFLGASFEKDLILENARIYSMMLENVSFGSESIIDLNKADYIRLVVPWWQIKDRLVFNGAAYLALVKNYKNLEWFDDADDCYFQYRKIDQDRKGFGWAKLIDIISWLSCGYGVRVSYTIFWCIFTIFFFGLLFWAGNGMRKFEFEGLEIPVYFSSSAGKEKRVSLIDALYFSTAMFTTSQAPVNTYPVRHYRHLAMVEGILGWFFLGLFVVVLSGMLIR